MKLAIAREGMKPKLGSALGTRFVALGLAASLAGPGLLAGCGGGNQASAPPLDATRGQAPMAPSMQAQGQRQGMSTRQKVVLLAGAAALYYMYKKRRDANNRPLPQNVQYYQSRNGRIYYRDPQTKQAIYVTPPQRLQVNESELQGLGDINRYQGYPSGNGNLGIDAIGIPAS